MLKANWKITTKLSLSFLITRLLITLERLSNSDSVNRGETTNSDSNNSNGSSVIDVGKYEKEGSLMIIDSVKGYFGSDSDYEGEDRLMSFFKQLVKKAESLGKDGVSVIADLGSFYHHQSINATKKLFEHELSLPSKYEGMKFKGFCAYHKADFDRRFTEEQKQKLLDHHSKALMIAS
jgi:hypothetical protein